MKEKLSPTPALIFSNNIFEKQLDFGAWNNKPHQMDNVQSPEILDITLSSNQNGASLGEQKKGSNGAKPTVSKVRYRFHYLTEFF